MIYCPLKPSILRLIALGRRSGEVTERKKTKVRVMRHIKSKNEIKTLKTSHNIDLQHWQCVRVLCMHYVLLTKCT